MPPMLNPYDPLPLSGGVGQDMKNDPDDVYYVTCVLNMIHPSWGGPKKELDEKKTECTPKLINAISHFQSHYFRADNAIDYQGAVLPESMTRDKMLQVLGGGVDLVIFPRMGDEYFKVERYHSGWSNCLIASTISQMVTKIIARLEEDPGKLIMHLNIVGHGSAGHQSLSPIDDTNWGDATITLSSVVEENPSPGSDKTIYGTAASHLARLRGKFMPNGIVTLGGCQVALVDTYEHSPKTGAGPPRTVDGKNLLIAVSTALGVAVQGAVDYQEPGKVGMEGPCVRCKDGACFVINADDHMLAGDWWGPTANFVPPPPPPKTEPAASPEKKRWKPFQRWRD